MYTKARFGVKFVVVFAKMVGVAASVNAQGMNDAVSVEQLLNSVPISMEAQSSSIYEGHQSITSIPRNLESLYGVGSVLEVPSIDGQQPEPSLLIETHVPFEVAESTTLEEFLDRACSDGRLAWGIVHNAIHIWPVAMRPGKESCLDRVKVSLDLQKVSLLEAGKAWARAVDRSLPGHIVRIRHPFVGTNIWNGATPTSLACEQAVTVKLENVTAREALCAIQGASTEWVRISYYHKMLSQDTVTFFPCRSDMNAVPEISPEERHALDVQEDLDSVLVAPATEGVERGG